MKKYAGFVYEAVNNITGMKYIGSYIGVDTDISYGNTRSVIADIKKYGVENFSRTVLEYVKTVDMLGIAETKHLTKVNAKTNPMYYNRSNKSSERGVCGVCHINLVAVNYVTEDKTYYRNLCSSCIRKSKQCLRITKHNWHLCQLSIFNC